MPRGSQGSCTNVLNSCYLYNNSIHTVHDDAKDKEFELEMSWVCTESKGRHEFVPTEIAHEAERLAKVYFFDTFILYPGFAARGNGRGLIIVERKIHYCIFNHIFT